MLNASILDTLKDSLTDIAKTSLMNQAQNYDVLLKTNLGPAINIDPFAQSTEPNLLEKLGVQFSVTLRDKGTGNVVYQSAPPPDTDPTKVAVLIGGGALLSFIILRGLLKWR